MQQVSLEDTHTHTHTHTQSPTWPYAASLLMFLDHTQLDKQPDQLVAEATIYTTQQTTDQHPFRRRDSNPRSQQLSGYRPTR